MHIQKILQKYNTYKLVQNICMTELPKLIQTCTCDTCMTSLIYVTCNTCMTSLTWTGSCRRSPRSPHNTDTRSPRYTGTPPSLGLHHSHEAAKRTHIFTPRENPSSINAPKKVWRTSFMLFSFHGERYPGLFDFWDFFDA